MRLISYSILAPGTPGAGHYGDYRSCDTPPWTLEGLFSHLVSKQEQVAKNILKDLSLQSSKSLKIYLSADTVSSCM